MATNTKILMVHSAQLWRTNARAARVRVFPYFQVKKQSIMVYKQAQKKETMGDKLKTILEKHQISCDLVVY